MALTPGSVQQVCGALKNAQDQRLQVLALALVTWLLPYLLLRDFGPSLDSSLMMLGISVILLAAVTMQMLTSVSSEVQVPVRGQPVEVEWSSYMEALLDKAIAMSDGTDGSHWHHEGHEQSTEIFSQDMGTRFPAFLGKVEVSGDDLRERSPVSTACTAEEVFAFSMSFSGRQLSDAYRATDTIIQRLGSNAWLSYQTWSGNHVQAPQASLFLQGVRKSSSAGASRFTCVTVPAPTTLMSAYRPQVDDIKKDRTFKDAPHKFSMVDIKSLSGGGLRVSNVLHVDPSVPRFIPSSLVQSFIKTGVCRGATYLDMASKLTLPQPLSMEGPATKESLEQVTIGGQTCKVSRLLAEILAER